MTHRLLRIIYLYYESRDSFHRWLGLAPSSETAVIALSRMRRLRASRCGFSIYELVTVVALLVGLAGMAGMSVVDYLADSKIEKARKDCLVLSEACHRQVELCPEMPISDLKTVLVADPSLSPELSDLRDPWGKPYQVEYHADSERWRIFTIAPDGTEISN